MAVPKSLLALTVGVLVLGFAVYAGIRARSAAQRTVTAVEQPDTPVTKAETRPTDAPGLTAEASPAPVRLPQIDSTRPPPEIGQPVAPPAAPVAIKPIAEPPALPAVAERPTSPLPAPAPPREAPSAVVVPKGQAAVVPPPLAPKPPTPAAPKLPTVTFQDARPIVATAPPPLVPPPVPQFADRRALVEQAPPLKKAPSFEDQRPLQGPARPEPAAAQLPQAASTCPSPEIAGEPLDGGRMLLRVASACRAGQSVSLGYGGITLARQLDGTGRLETTLDLFAGAAPVEVAFGDSTRWQIAARGNDLDRVDKVAIIWSAPVDLDLHVFEHGSTASQPGHVWASAPSSASAARDLVRSTRQGRGFLSRADAGQGQGDKLEVYTFFREDSQPRGTVQVLVDYASRGEVPSGAACGAGEHARVAFRSITISRGFVVRANGQIQPAECGVPLAAGARFTPLPQQQRSGR